MSILSDFQHDQEREAKRILGRLIQAEQYVGDVYSIGYEFASVQIHDIHRQQVGGIPSLCFLVATRIPPNSDVNNYQEEDASVILLRVMDSTPLPTDAEAERVRVEIAQRVAGELQTNWDDRSIMDFTTHYLLSFAGIKCRVLGTFYVDTSERQRKLVLRFGSDISNYYPNRGLKVFKPNQHALAEIVNYVDLERQDHPLSDERVRIGEVRYASTNRSFQGVSNVPVYISPVDLLAQKSALFGMTRTGKSNTTKIILQSVFELRYAEHKPSHIGQLVFDVNGEYANENTQDANQHKNPSAIKNVWRAHKNGDEADVVTYGIQPHSDDPKRRLMLLNFHDEQNLQTGKGIIDDALAEDAGIQFVQAFRQVRLIPPDPEDGKSSNPDVQKAYRRLKTRYERHVLAYRALLAKAQFTPPPNLRPRLEGLFNDDLIRALRQEVDDTPQNDDDSGDQRRARRTRTGSGSSNASNYRIAATILSQPNPTWEQVGLALEYLDQFIDDRDSGYAQFNERYMGRANGSGDPWADETFKKILAMFRWPSGARRIGRLANQHTSQLINDYAVSIYQDLLAGRLVIVDQSGGDEGLNKLSADRIMTYIFDAQRSLFRSGKPTIPDILIYVEEAHNLLPASSEDDYQNIWVRTAKEGAKYQLGLVYATQEVSSIQRNILKNTANWFIGHLNNADETRELCKYYDFVDFEASIRRAQDRGFLRVKTLSNPFTVPVQIRKFEV